MQGTVGNAAVVQMLGRAGDTGAQERTGPSPVQRSAVPDVLRSSGRPLDGAVRMDMESRLGADFSDVRIHDDSTAKASAAEVGAHAYTSGNHIVMGDGGGDAHTLAHELTHVIQQRSGPVAGTDNGAGLKVSDPSDRFEREAEANATRAMRRRVVPSGPAPERTARTAPLGTAPIQRVKDPEKDALKTFGSRVEALAAKPKAIPEHFVPEIESFLANTDPATRTARVKKMRVLIDELPDHFADKAVNAAHSALNPYDHTRPALAVPGAEYVSASYVDDSVGNGYINRDLPGVVVIENEPYVPVYSAVFADALTVPKPMNKDVGQDQYGLIQIHTGDPGPGEKVLWVSIGQPLRQLKWVEKYRIHGNAQTPMIRSFLVPLRIANDISRGAITEHNSGGEHTEDLNVDKHFSSNQFGVRDPESLESLRQYALPGSLRTYTDGDPAGQPDSWGDVRETGEMRDKLGVPRTNIPGFPVFTEESGEFLSHAKYEERTSTLRQVAAAHTKSPALLEGKETLKGASFVKEFFLQHAPENLKEEGARGLDESRKAIDKFVTDFVVPWATQARIAEEVYDGFHEFPKSKPTDTPVNYRLTNEEPTLRGQRRTETVATGADQRGLMQDRSRIRQGFDALNFANKDAFTEAGTNSEALSLLGQLRQKRKDVLADYGFKIGDRDTLISKNPEYAEAAAGFHTALSGHFPDVEGRPALKAILTGLGGIGLAP